MKTLPNEMIKIVGLYKDYITPAGPFPVLKDIHLTIRQGEFVAIMGHSGSGKSTFMNILGCLDKPTQGDYFLGQKNVAQLDKNDLARVRNQTIGFVFQGFNLLPRMSLEENIALPLVYSGMDRQTRLHKAGELLEKVGLSRYAHSRPNQISGGQQQRIAIARALVNHPPLILADEPTGNLDSRTSNEIMELFTALNQEGMTIVLVTHEPDVAAYASRQVLFKDGQIIRDEATGSQQEETACLSPC